MFLLVMKKIPFFKHLSFFCFVFFVSLTTLVGQGQKEAFVVVLDAGHGGKDTGNRGNGYYEKHIALNITKLIGAKLQKQDGIKIIFTRTDDRFIPLKNRAKIANQADADLFISIHCDAFTSPKAYGAGTFVLGLHRTKDNFRIAQKENSVIFLEEDYETTYDGFDPNNPESVISLLLMQETYQGQSIEAASTIQKSFIRNLKRKDRTVKQAGFLVLRETYMPSVLVEVGFLTNKKEGQYLNSKKGQQEMASTISKAILNYRNQLAASVSVSVQDSNVSDTMVEPTPKKTVNKRAVTVEKTTAKGIVFKVQIAASARSLELTPANFKGLKGLSVQKAENLYRYFYGKANQYKAAEILKQTAVKAGYDYAFIVAFKDGVKINISDAISQK